MKENGRASAASLVQHSRNTQFYGFSLLIRRDSNGNGIAEYVILDTNWKEWELYCTYTVDMEKELLRFREDSPPHLLPWWQAPSSRCTMLICRREDLLR